MICLSLEIESSKCRSLWKWMNKMIYIRHLFDEFFGNQIRGQDLMRFPGFPDICMMMKTSHVVSFFRKSNQGARFREISRISWDFLPWWESVMQKRRLARLSILPLPDPTPGVATEFQIILTFRFHHQHTCISIIIIIRTPGWSALIQWVGGGPSPPSLWRTQWPICRAWWGYNIHSHHIVTVLYSWAWFCTVADGFTQWWMVDGTLVF